MTIYCSWWWDFLKYCSNRERQPQSEFIEANTSGLFGECIQLAGTTAALLTELKQGAGGAIRILLNEKGWRHCPKKRTPTKHNFGGWGTETLYIMNIIIIITTIDSITNCCYSCTKRFACPTEAGCRTHWQQTICFLVEQFDRRATKFSCTKHTLKFRVQWS